MAFMHIYLKYTQPLFIQALMGLKNLYDAKLVAIHVLGRPAEGDLKRPFKSAGMFGGTFRSSAAYSSFTDTSLLRTATPAGPATDNASIAEAEKRVGAKKDE